MTLERVFVSQMPAKISNLTAINVENAGHFIHKERPELVTKSMLDFMQDRHQASTQ